MNDRGCAVRTEVHVGEEEEEEEGEALAMKVNGILGEEEERAMAKSALARRTEP